jgi:sugar O-acyltransferase (sialic acid O-acetyltransferase NeuD family)
LKPLLLVGSSGHARSVLEVIELQGQYRVLGLLDSFAENGSQSSGHTICGRPEEAAEIAKAHSCRTFFIAVGDNWQRWRITSELREAIPGVEFVTLMHPTAVVARTAQIGAGTVLMPFSYIGVNAYVGEGCIVNVSSSVNHDCRIDDYSSLSAGVHMGGGSSVGFRSSMGLSSHLREKVKIGKDTVVGAGAAVIEDMPDCAVVFGVPARVKRTRTLDDKYMR